MTEFVSELPCGEDDAAIPCEHAQRLNILALHGDGISSCCLTLSRGERGFYAPFESPEHMRELACSLLSIADEWEHPDKASHTPLQIAHWEGAAIGSILLARVTARMSAQDEEGNLSVGVEPMRAMFVGWQTAISAIMQNGSLGGRPLTFETLKESAAHGWMLAQSKAFAADTGSIQ